MTASLLPLALSLLTPQTPESTGDKDRPGPFAGMHYRCVGPTRGGRVTTVTGVVQAPGTFYMGATGGGVWRTTDFGHSWHCLSDRQFATASIGAIRVAPTDPDTIWVGTGSDGLRSNVITGRGIYKSTDAGKTWRHVGLTKTGQIGAVEIHPQNKAVVFVAAIGNAFGRNAERGLYRTRNGGQTWERVLFVSKATGIADVEFNPADPTEMYAAAWQAERKPWTIRSGGDEGGIFRSRDGGSTWTKLSGGLPDGLVGKADLAVSPADPTRLYVLIEAPGDKGGVYRSADRGESFVQVSADKGLRTRPFYYTNIDADPTDADVVYVCATGFYKSTDGGETWRRRSTPHGDNHDIWIHPERPQLFVQANDGGANVTLDGGRTWSTQRNQPTAELYQVAVDDRFPYWLYAGQQDNSTIRVPVLPPHPAPAGPQGYWQSVGGCETGPAVPKPGDADIVYAACKGRFGVYNFRTGQERQYYVGAANMYGHNPRDLKYRFQRVSPIHLSPHDHRVIYHASQFVHKSTDEGRTWQVISPDLTANDSQRQVISGAPITRDITGEEFYSCLYSLRESPVASGTIWVGANDGPIHVTRDGGKSWRNVTPTQLPPGGRVQTLEPSPHVAGKAYACVLRYQLDDWRPHVYRTDDFGASWSLLTTGDNGIPADTPTRVVREDPTRPGLLYCGTEFGMFVSFDDGARWHSLQLDLPVTPITDIVVHRGDLVLSTMGRSFWVLDDLSPLRAWNADLARADVHLVAPRPAHRMRYRGSSGVPEYPPPGATIDYWLAAAPKADDAIRLDILAADDTIVRSFSSQAAGERERPPREPTMRAPRLERIGTPKLPAKAGHNRFRWDMRHAGAWHAEAARSGRGGPLVAPGKYRLRLTVGSAQRTVELEIRIDPRVAAEGTQVADLRVQETLALRVRDALSNARRLAARIERTAKASAAKADRLAPMRRALVTADQIYPQPKLIDQLNYLYRMLDRADQAPGRDAVERCAELETELRALTEKADAIGSGTERR